jgi:tRNA A37 threonylcarbamoyladenosine dehydratase
MSEAVYEQEEKTGIGSSFADGKKINGSMVTVTAAAGMALASLIIREVARNG